MIRCKPIVWSIFLWALVFMYTWFEFKDYEVHWKVLPVITWCVGGIALIILLAKDAVNKKSLILALSWSIIVSIGLLLYNFGQIDSTGLNVHVTIMSAIVAVIWCITSHAEHVTEAGLHWYIWFMLLILTLCCTFNSESPNGQLVYILAATISFIIHAIYIWHVFKIQSSGPERCQHVFRILACFILTTILLVSSILLKTASVTFDHWRDIIFTVEILAVIVIITDYIVGFAHDPIKHGYENVNQNAV